MVTFPRRGRRVSGGAGVNVRRGGRGLIVTLSVHIHYSLFVEEAKKVLQSYETNTCTAARGEIYSTHPTPFCFFCSFFFLFMYLFMFD